MSMGAFGDMSSFGAGWQYGLSSGDPYGDTQDLTRSVRFLPSTGGDAFGALGSDCCKVPENFASTDSPPPLPRHEFFKLASTTLCLQGLPADELGNRLLTFLRMRATTAVKLRRGKFTLKAEALVNEISCTVKLRVYAMSDGSFAVEVQRRTGDAITFAVLYGMLVQHLMQHGHHLKELPFKSKDTSSSHRKRDCKEQAFGASAHAALDNFVVSFA